MSTRLLSAISLLKIVFVFALWFPIAGASADTITLETTVNSKVENGQLHFAVTVKNVGNEEALEIALEFPTLTRKFPIASAVAAGETKSVDVDFALSEPSPKAQGTFTIPYRLTYKDTNGYGLSSAQLLIITQPPAPSRQLAIRFTGAGPAPELALAESGTIQVAGEVKNLGSEPVAVESIYAISSLELRHDVSVEGLPRELKPKESLPFTLNVSNEGVLRGSKCAGFFVVEGQVEGLRLSEQIGYKINVLPPTVTSRWLLLGCFALALVAILSVKRRAGKR